MMNHLLATSRKKRSETSRSSTNAGPPNSQIKGSAGFYEVSQGSTAPAARARRRSEARAARRRARARGGGAPRAVSEADKDKDTTLKIQSVKGREILDSR